MTRDEAAPTTREAILAAAGQLLADRGAEGVSMRSVADRVGLSATAIYHHFRNKEDLIASVVDEGYRSFGAYLEAAARRHPPGTLERIAALGEAYVRFGIEHQAHFRVLFEMRTDLPRHLHELPDEGGYPLLRRHVVEAMRAGTLCEYDPDLVSLLLWTVAHGLVALQLSGTLPDFEHQQGIPDSPMELLRAFEHLIMNGIRAGEGAAGSR